ncbi:ABC transporter ATP-binding protein [Halobacterium wangiae]|uniref:ABC transporter ATP-binding protein n=1 Tax=Halobacterium wangiae TaxID=2902623 RepID=UPI001E2D13C9|nr:ABC transporter ATP-binding protein [Halobacterium wangiae]
MTGTHSSTGEPTPTDDDVLLSMRDLHVEFETYDGTVYALDGVDLDVKRGRTTGLVGETGCGKTVTARSILQLVDDPGRISAGEILYKGRNLLDLSPEEMRNVRGNEIAMIFQEPMKSLNPSFTIRDQLTTVIQHHTDRDSKAAADRALSILEELEFPDPEAVLSSYPHELSGGMAQRVLIALALSCEPDLLLADEPTTALDVTIQAQILELLDRIQEEFGTSILLITHNLGVVDRVADDVNVMYAGKVVETGPTDRVFEDPKHPYTLGLLRSLPERDVEEMYAMEGDVPDLRNPPEGCRFAPRCPVAKPECETYDPPETSVGSERTVRCLHYEPDAPGSPEEVHDGV